MEKIIGRYCKDCIVYSDTLEQDARSIIYGFVNHKMFENSKIRIMPDVHAGKDIVVGFTAPFEAHVNPDHIGTVGSGNHFVEIGATPEGNYAITVHCGSRNFGQKVWKYWKMVASNPQFNHPAVGYLTGEQMKGYITDMVIAQAYAEFNHITIHRIITEIFREVCGDVEITEQIITTHNYIDFKSRMMRKGAVASLKGEKLVIPFNMRDGLIICEGKSNPEWNCSAPHGAGRLLSRSAAKELINMEEYEESMKGVFSTSVQHDTIDESPMAYKDPKEILDAIKDTVEVLYFIKPVINMKNRSNDKATDEEQD